MPARDRFRTLGSIDVNHRWRSHTLWGSTMKSTHSAVAHAPWNPGPVTDAR